MENFKDIDISEEELDSLWKKRFNYYAEKNLRDQEEELTEKGLQEPEQRIEKLYGVGLKDLDANTEAKNQALMAACEKEDLKATSFLIDKGAKIDYQDQEGDTLLHKAIKEERLRIAFLLIEKGADLDVQNKNGDTPLHRAFQCSRYDMAAFLILMGADINLKNKYGGSPFDGNDNEISNFLAAPEANAMPFGAKDLSPILTVPEAKTLPFEIKDLDPVFQNALHCGAEDGDLQQVKLTLKKGANINHQDEKGMTPLFKAVWKKQIKVAKYLIDQGADINLRSKKSGSPLTKAAQKNVLELAAYLIQHGAELDHPGDQGNAPIHWAANHNNYKMAEYLLKKGAKLDLANKDGLTALDIARKRKFDDLTELLS